MTTTPDDDWLHEFARTTRTEMLTVYHRHTCVLATRIGHEVLRYFGIGSTPEAVRVGFFTADAFAELENGIAGKPAAGYSVGVMGTGAVTHQVATTPLGAEPAATTGPDLGTSWDGHLVTRLTGPPRLIDLSADQFDRPEHGLPVPGPVVIPLPDTTGWDANEWTAMTRADGVRMLYQRLDNHAWRRSNDWTLLEHGGEARAVVARVIRRLRSTTP